MMANPGVFPWHEKTVALVGSAESLLSSDFGPDIDSHDIVVRINQGAFAALQPESTGLRTDFVFLTLTGGTIRAKAMFLWKAKRSARRGVVLMSQKGRSLFGIDLAGFFLHYPASWQDALITQLGHRPSTGAMAVDLLTRTLASPEQLDLYGFDFFRTPDIAHGRNRVVAHDPDVEKSYILGQVPPERFHASPEVT
jgi:hypothetical protein